jgi:hypothetical protein
MRFHHVWYSRPNNKSSHYAQQDGVLKMEELILWRWPRRWHDLAPRPKGQVLLGTVTMELSLVSSGFVLLGTPVAIAALYRRL